MESPTPDQLTEARQLLESEADALKAIAQLEQFGTFEAAFDHLWTDLYGPSQLMGADKPTFWHIVIKRLRQEICGQDDSFREKVKDYKKNPASAPLFTGLIVSLVKLSGIPLDPALGTIVILYLLNIGIDVFCEYTAPPPSPSPNAGS